MWSVDMVSSVYFYQIVHHHHHHHHQAKAAKQVTNHVLYPMLLFQCFFFFFTIIYWLSNTTSINQFCDVEPIFKQPDHLLLFPFLSPMYSYFPKIVFFIHWTIFISYLFTNIPYILCQLFLGSPMAMETPKSSPNRTFGAEERRVDEPDNYADEVAP